jgi:hypothetical protein
MGQGCQITTSWSGRSGHAINMKRLLWLLLGTLAWGQATVLMPLPRFQALTVTGQPLLNGCLFTYAAGTTTPQATYTDSTGGTPNANPVILDSLGSASIWFATNSSYKLALWSPGSPANSTCSNGALLWSQDNVTGLLTTLTSTSGDASFTVTSTVSGHTSTGTFNAVTSNANNGEIQFQITNSTPFGWKFCTTFGGSSCPVKIAGGGVNGLFDVGSTAGTVAVTNTTGDAAVTITSNNGVNSSNVMFDAVTSNGNNGEFQLKITNATPFGWKFAASNPGTNPVFFSGTAPTNSLQVTSAGNVQTVGNFCFNATLCVYAGAGVPSINCAIGSLWLRSDAPSASTVAYVCYPLNTWSAVTVP